MKLLSQVALILVALAVGVVGGYGWKEIKLGHAPNLRSLPSAISGDSIAQAHKPYETFLHVMSSIDSNYYGSPDRQALLYAGVAGMMDSVKDPYTVFMEPEQADRFRETSAGAFVKSGGIGAELTPDPLGPRVRHVFKGGPAAEAGVLPDDVVVKVNGQNAAGKDVTDVVSKIRGEPGTTVQLTFFRASTNQTLSFVFTRRLAQIQDVYSSVLNTTYTHGKPKIGYIELRKFTATVAQQFDEEISSLKTAGVRGIIIDLRGNPGGLMQAAVELSARFFENKLVTSMKPRVGETESYFAPTGYADSVDVPVVLIVDGETASAAEIFAGALKDYKLATLVGEQTFGKGAVQKTFPLKDGAQAKITIGKYYLPMGESVDRVVDETGEKISGGIIPNTKVTRKPGSRIDLPEGDDQLKAAATALYSKIR